MNKQHKYISAYCGGTYSIIDITAHKTIFQTKSYDNLISFKNNNGVHCVGDDK